MSPQCAQSLQPHVMTLLKAARPDHLDPAADPQRRQHDLARALGEAGQLSNRRRQRVIRPSRVVYGLSAATAVAAIAVAISTVPGLSREPAETASPGSKPAALGRG